MRAIDNAGLLDLWEAGLHVSPMRRALLLLRAAFPEEAEAERWPLGAINWRLLAVRARLFGPELVCLADCGACGAVGETTVSLPSLLGQAGLAEVPGPVPGVAEGARTELEVAGPAAIHARMHELEEGGCAVRFRLPCAYDLLALGPDSGLAAEALFERIVESAVQDGAALAPRHIPDTVRAAVERRIEALDPFAHIELVVTCPVCTHRWTEPLHIVDVLWSELGNLAQRLLSEVGRLAQAFGWSEAQILGLSDVRRRHYLEWLGA
jgi:hypothetical protein